jgi:hypothetical protein
MNANDYPRRPSIPVPEELFEVSNRLRQANYKGEWKEQAIPKLEQFARTLKARTSLACEDEIYYLRSLCLQAEIHDYYGDYDLARLALQESGQALEKKLNDDELGVPSQTLVFSKSLLRQQLWALIFYAHSLYRDGRYKDALTLLEYKIRGQLDRHLPLNTKSNADEPSYGLRARLAYSLGQVKRQMADIRGVRDEFMSAIEFTRKRLLAKIEIYRGDEFASVRLREKRYSSYFIAKAFAFGLSWASYNSGQLDRARAAAAAGCALLETTEDELHKAYAQVMYAQILTAKTLPVEPGRKIPVELQEAFEILQRLVERPESALRKIPKFLARAQYALVGALFSSGQYDKAEILAKAIYESTEQHSRWHLECMALLVRILLKKGSINDARRYSDELSALTREKTASQNARAEALLCHAEILLKAKINLDEIDKALTEAQTLWAANPLSTVICHLHRARLYVLKKNSAAAQNELSVWRASEQQIEQGYVRELAKNVAEEIAELDDRFVITPRDVRRLSFDGVEEELKRWAIRYLYSQCGEDYLKNGNPERILGRGASTIRLWQRELDFYPVQPDEEDSTSSASASS